MGAASKQHHEVDNSDMRAARTLLRAAAEELAHTPSPYRAKWQNKANRKTAAISVGRIWGEARARPN
jgi:hypothetical protein